MHILRCYSLLLDPPNSAMVLIYQLAIDEPGESARLISPEFSLTRPMCLSFDILAANAGEIKVEERTD